MIGYKFCVLSGEAIEKFSAAMLAQQVRSAYEAGVRTIYLVDTDAEVQPVVDKLNKQNVHVNL